MQAEQEGMETLVNSWISLSPVLAVAPQEQMCEAAPAFASRRIAGLGKTRTIHLLLTSGDTTGAQGHHGNPYALLQCAPLHSHLTQCRLVCGGNGHRHK